MRIDQIAVGDLEDVSQLFSRYRQFYGEPDEPLACQRFLNSRLQGNEAILFGAWQDTTLVGFTQLYPSFSSVAMQRVWILNDLFVDEHARRQGVGKALLNRAVAFAEQTHAARLVLCTGVENKAAKTLYESEGWRLHEGYDYYVFTPEVTTSPSESG